MSEENEFIQSKDGLNLYLRHWAADSPKHVLCITHGLGEHSGRYEAFAKYLNARSIAVVAFDLRGHGQSQGKRGHAANFEAVLSDVEEMLKFARAEYNDLPMYLYGHSLGGNIVANFVQSMKSTELAGFILSSPFFKVAFEPPAWKAKLAGAVRSLLPSLTQPTELEVDALSRLHEEVKKYQDDPLVHDKISVRLFLESTAFGQKALDRMEELPINGLVYHGTEDRITSCEASKEFSERNATKVKWYPFEGGYHELHNDECKDEVYNLVSEFVSRD